MSVTRRPLRADQAHLDASAARERLGRRVQIVVGKGGVGRTSVATALGVRAAREGLRTLVLEVDAPDSVAKLLGARPAVDQPREVQNNLFICRMTPAGALHEYALMVLRFKPLYNLVFENRLVKYLLRSIPSLGEFTMLGKAWFHTTETRPDGEPKYQRVIIDAPATGHAVTFLALARLVADISPAGVMREAATKMADLVESEDQTCLHVVSLPEEMPVNEAIELTREARHRLHAPLGLGFMNRVLPPLLDEDGYALVDALEREDASLAPYVRSASRRRDREGWQAEHIERFIAGAGLPTVQLPDLGGDGVEQVSIEALICALEAFAEVADD